MDGITTSDTFSNALAVPFPNGMSNKAEFKDGLKPYLDHSENTDEKESNGERIAHEAGNVELPPSAQAFYSFDWGLGDALTQKVVIESIHMKFSNMPVVAVYKEYLGDNVLIGFKNLAKTLVDHPETALVVTNKVPNFGPASAENFVWKEVRLKGNSEEGFKAQIEGLREWVAEHWKFKPGSTTVHDHPAVLVVCREDQAERLEKVVPHQGDTIEGYNLVTYTQAYKLSRPLGYTVERTLAPGLNKLAPGGVGVVIQAADTEPGQQIRQSIWPDFVPIKNGPENIKRGVEEVLTPHGKTDGYTVSVGPNINYRIRPIHADDRGQYDNGGLHIVYNAVVYHYQQDAEGEAEAATNKRYQEPIRKALIENNGRLSLANSVVRVLRAPDWSP